MLVALWRDGVDADEIAGVLDLERDHVYRLASRLRQRGVDLPRRVARTARRAQHEQPRRGTPFDQILSGTWTGTA
ncbi:MAG TPA: hypothetical protein VFF79_12605 [Conexibacter sp.]|nr:hypothetical protein [Conexibacter sp.]